MPGDGPTTVSAGGSQSLIAKANYDFDGKNNDELTFRRNDLITITQQLEGGWWEGTLAGQTGWFPSGFVTILTEKDRLMRSRSVPNAHAVVNGGRAASEFLASDSTRSQFRADVLSGFVKSEEKYIASIRKTNEEILAKIKEAKIMSEDDFSTICFNIGRIHQVQSDILNEVTETVKLESSKQRIGGIFMRAAVVLRQLLPAYCENHPRAVEVLNEKKDSLNSLLDSCDLGGIQALITGLSEPFRHLEKYPPFLQELERNISEGHIDRGDLQRSCAVYKDIKQLSDAARKQKEMQLELLYTGNVEKWAPFAERGKILYVGTGPLTEPNGDVKDRCLTLFEKYLFILEVAVELNEYRMITRIPTTGLHVQALDGKAAISFGSPAYTLSTSSPFDTERWLEAFSKCESAIVADSVGSLSSAPLTARPPTPQKYSLNSMNAVSPPRHADISVLPSSTRAHQIEKKSSFGHGDLRFNHELEMILPEGSEGTDDVRHGEQKAYFLRAIPPYRGPAHLRPSSSGVTDGGKKNVKLRKGLTQEEQEDALLLRIVEGYCSGAARAPLTTSDSAGPQLIVAEDEKILVEEVVGDELVLQEKSLVDTVYALKDQVSGLRQELMKLASVVDKEQKARRRLEEAIRKGNGVSLSPSANSAFTKLPPSGSSEMTTSSP